MARNGPADIYQPGQVEKSVDTNYKFLHELFSNNSTLRSQLMGCKTEQDARTLLGNKGITVQPPIRIMVVDIESATTKTWDKPINPKTDSWYVLVLPPVPRRKPDKSHTDAQAMLAAWYHASNDGYGM